MSSSVCFARGTRKHRRPLPLFLSVKSPQRSTPLRSRIPISPWVTCALWIAASLVAGQPASIAAQDAAALLPAAPAQRAMGCSAASTPPGLTAQCRPPEPLIVIGFMGGHVRADNLVHREARLARDLDRRYPNAVRAMTFANRDEAAALHSVLELLDTNKDGRLSDGEKSAARIILFGHSWGASETVNLAQELDRRSIPVLLTIQVDSVRKPGEQDGNIPANVREAINFYQTEGILHGRRLIQAVDPKRTTILGNYESTYKMTPVLCAGFPWFARAFMKPHIEIENDVAVWNRIDALIVARSCSGTGVACGEMSATSSPPTGRLN